MTEQIVRELVDGVWVTRAANEGGGGSTAGAARVLGPFPFSHATAGLDTGMLLWTPAVGDVLLDAWVEVDTGFDGTTPLADIGTFIASNQGIWLWGDTSPVDLTAADTLTSIQSGDLLSSSTSSPANSLYAALVVHSAALTSRLLPAKFTTANPLLLVASQDGTKGGTALDSTVGAGAVYLVVATPSIT